MADDMTLANRLAPVQALEQAKTDAARRAVLARIDLPARSRRRLDQPDALDVLAMLGLVDDPRVHPRTGQWLPAHRTAEVSRG